MPKTRAARAVLLGSILALCSLSSLSWASDKGKALYALCSSCHGFKGEGNEAVGAPVIDGLPEWYLITQLVKFKDGIRAGHPRDLYGHKMRPMARSLTEEDIKIVSAYVAARPKPAVKETVQGRIVDGEAKFQVCVACHGTKAEGNQNLGAPPLAGANDWYLLRQLKNFKGKVRGGDPTRDVFGGQMQGISAALDDDAMVNVVTYINSLK